MSQQTEACKKILVNIETALRGTCFPVLMMQNILDEAQSMVTQGYVWDVALAKACQIYPATRYCAQEIW